LKLSFNTTCRFIPAHKENQHEEEAGLHFCGTAMFSVLAFQGNCHSQCQELRQELETNCDPDTFNIKGLAAVTIGYNVTANGDHSFALGKFASTNGFSGSLVWGDGSATSSLNTFNAIANNEFAARATGGFRFRTNLAGTTGCNLPAGSGVFNCTSSRTTKENFSS
jgi:hypothetical protein